MRLKKSKYFVSIVNAYFETLHHFSLEENYQLHALSVAKKMGYEVVVIVKGGESLLKNDPHIMSGELKGIIIEEYKNFFHFSFLLLKYCLKQSVFYINSHTAASYFSIIFTWMFSNRSIFVSHATQRRRSSLLQTVQYFLFLFVSRLRLTNVTEKVFLRSRGVPENKLYVVPFVNDLTTFNKNKGITERKDIVSFGSVNNHKNLQTMFTAFSLVKQEDPSAIFHVIGEWGDYDPTLDIERLNIKESVVFYGKIVHGERLNNLLNSFLVYVNSSFSEGQCLATFEAARAGCALCLPTIDSFVGVFKDKALFHDVRDYQALSENILTYIRNRDLAEKYNESCLNLISEKYSKEVVENDLVVLFTF